MEISPEAWVVRRSPKDSLPIRHEDDRTPFDRDRARIVHTSAFRRLQAKTQVLGINEGNFHRTRLTHSMEVAQIATGISARFQTKHGSEFGAWLPSRELMEAICFAHDLGHPPFGHAGEAALNYALLTAQAKENPAIGFEGNGQTLRLLTQLEAHTNGYGLDLTRRTLLGVLKYPVMFSIASRFANYTPMQFHQIKWSEWKPPKCYMDTEADSVNWVLEPFAKEDREQFTECPNPKPGKLHCKPESKSLDCSIMDLADGIAYGVHDFEDGIALKLINKDDWIEKISPAFCNDWAKSVKLDTKQMLESQLFVVGKESASARKRAVGGLVNALISSVKLKELTNYRHPLLKLNAVFDEPAQTLLDALQKVIEVNIIFTPNVQTLEYRGQMIIHELFRAIESDPTRFLPAHLYSHDQSATRPSMLRVIADYVGGMTDEYATRLFERMFVPRHGTIFDRL